MLPSQKHEQTKKKFNKRKHAISTIPLKIKQHSKIESVIESTKSCTISTISMLQ